MLLPTFCFGQKFEVALTVGPAFFSSTSATIVYYQYPIKTALYSGMVVSMQLPKMYNVGINFGGSEIKADYESLDNKTRVYATQLMNITLQGNKHIKLFIDDMYFGISLGYSTYKNLDSFHFYKTYANEELITSRGKGLIMGVQLGFNYKLNRHFILNLEGGFSHISLKAQNRMLGGSPYNLSFNTFPITFGVKYGFAIGKKYKSPKPVKTHQIN